MNEIRLGYTYCTIYLEQCTYTVYMYTCRAAFRGAGAMYMYGDRLQRVVKHEDKG